MSERVKVRARYLFLMASSFGKTSDVSDATRCGAEGLLAALFTKLLSSVLPVVGTTLETIPAAGPIHDLRDFQELSQAKSGNGQVL